MTLAVREVYAKSILNKSKVMDYCINPYVGCEHACVYCYARLFIPRYSGHEEKWGSFVDVKINAAKLLEKQIHKAEKKPVWISGVTDPYQPLETKYMLTRKCLEILLQAQWPVTIQTKSALVLRDLNLLKHFEHAEVGFTITTDDEKIAKLFEPNAPAIRARIGALQKLHKEGIRTFAFIGPILPCSPKNLVELLTGKVDYVFIDKMNYERSIEWFYKKHNLEYALEKEFFERIKIELLEFFGDNGMETRCLF
jgi:DNA repair photolyase